jgi:hypothetical protein
MASSKTSKPKTRTLAELSPGDTVRYLGATWKVTGFLPPYANHPYPDLIGRELRCIEGKGAGVVTKIHESEEISTRFEVVEDLAA